MKFLELAATRQSVRAYNSDKPVEKEKIERCIEAARLAPSACNAQPWKFIIIDDQNLKNKIAEETTTRMLPLNHFTRQAPIMVVVVREKPNFNSAFGTMVRDKEFTVMDVGITSEHFCLQAAEEGLGTCMLGWFNEKNVKKLLDIPKSLRAELIICVGYPATPEIRNKIRKPIEKIVSYNKY